MDDKLKFIYELTKSVPHGERSFFEHLYSTSKVVQNRFPEEQYLIDAALYHAVYGTCYYKFDIEVDRNIVKNLIGEKSESLVYSYCNLEDRTHKIIENEVVSELQKDLCILEYANLAESPNPYSLDQIKQIKYKLWNQFDIDMSHNPLNDKLHVFDNKLTRAQVSHIHTYCLESNYRFEQASDRSSYQKDIRFTCHLNRTEFEDIGLINILEDISKELNVILYLKNYYINHYSQVSYVHRHTDSNSDGSATILIFCNKYWDESWGGELKIYDNFNSSINKVVDFVPGRIVIFDSKIEHKVLPLTPYAKSDRFSIAIKACIDPEKIYNFENLITIGVA